MVVPARGYLAGPISQLEVAVMGHRALVAYGRPGAVYDLRYSHWGGDGLALVEAITAATPLAEGAIDSSMLAESVALDRLLSAFLDPGVYEALYLVSPEFEVTAYRVFSVGWADGREQGYGALVEVNPGEDDCVVRTWFRATKTTLGDVIERGVLSRAAAREYLKGRIRADQNGRPYRYVPSRDCR